VGGESSFDAVLSFFRRGEGYDEDSPEPENIKKQIPTRRMAERRRVAGFWRRRERWTAMISPRRQWSEDNGNRY
jgi:hypothetical protein